MRAWPRIATIHWSVTDIADPSVTIGNYAVVVAYGLLHCLASPEGIRATLLRLQAHTYPGGYNVICAFNDAPHDLSGHPCFLPTLFPHEVYLSAYRKWTLIHASNQRLQESHPDNGVPHHHTLTRLLARKGP